MGGIPQTTRMVFGLGPTPRGRDRTAYLARVSVRGATAKGEWCQLAPVCGRSTKLAAVSGGTLRCTGNQQTAGGSPDRVRRQFPENAGFGLRSGRGDCARPFLWQVCV